MIKVLSDEEASDAERKTQCEIDLAVDTQDKVDTVTNIKSLTTDIDPLAKEVEEIEKHISDKKAEIVETEKQSAELPNNRKADDQALAMLQQATMVITGWYGATHTPLLQVTAHHKHSELAGAPETSWGAGEQYDGSKQSGNAISAVMKEVEADLVKDMDSAKLCENNAVKMYNDAQASMSTTITQLNS
ncbi:unnamed protein product [Polarella glacialis]|uniref:Uncharacterized protein n=1 Tax=Polarella glacialis TaxID=89957 RepID=A0A813G9I9_POLGL|nr:unnamed protein product [Polarella glacialis]CAE8631727.1 unnamed protein product [Polarella glacialis]